MESTSISGNELESMERSIGKAFVIGSTGLSIILGCAFILFYGVGKFFVLHGTTLDFVSDMLKTWQVHSTGVLFVCVVMVGVMFRLLLIVMLGIVIALLVAIILEVGGKEIFPSY